MNRRREKAISCGILRVKGVNATTFGKFKATKEEWKEMLQDGLVYHKEGNTIMF